MSEKLIFMYTLFDEKTIFSGKPTNEGVVPARRSGAELDFAYLEYSTEIIILISTEGRAAVAARFSIFRELFRGS